MQNIRPESRKIAPLITVVFVYVTLLRKCASVAEGKFVLHTKLVAQEWMEREAVYPVQTARLTEESRPMA